MNITRQLAESVAKTAVQPLDKPVLMAARRTLLNVLATAIGAARDQPVNISIDYGQRFGGHKTVPIPGRCLSMDPIRAALTVGLAAHLDDFDDTHLATVIHPGAATLAATLAVGVPNRVSGAQFLTAFALGCEVAVRVGVTMSPWHYDQGWHITGTCAPIGAAVAATLLHDGEPDADVLERAITIAAQFSLGNRETFGSMIKSFHPGKGAANGVLAAALAAAGATGSEDILGRADGFFTLLASHHEPELLNLGFGSKWELLDNTFKPYPCGIVCHPAIDAAVAIAPQLRGHLDQIESVEVQCHPLVAELTGNPQPKTGLQAKFSTIHGVAAGLCDGHVALAQYTDERVGRKDVVTVRSLSSLVVEAQRPRDSAAVTVHLRGGQTLNQEIAHARGSLARPLTQAELEDKVHHLVEPVLPGGSAALVSSVMELAAAPDLDSLLRAIQRRSPAGADLTDARSGE